MNRSRIGAIAITVIYIILIVAFLVLEKEPYSESSEFDHCSFKTPCINVCPGGNVANGNLSEYIKDNFPHNDVPDFDNETQLVQFPMECSSVEKVTVLTPDDSWEFEFEGGVNYKEDFGGKVYYSHSKYCIDSEKWNLQICTADHSLLKLLHYLLLFMAIALLFIPLIIYTSFSELRDTHGMLCIALMASQMIILTLMPTLTAADVFSDSTQFIVILGLYICVYSSNFIINAMCFDIYLTFKHFREPTYRSRYFKVVLIILGVVILLISSALFFEQWEATGILYFIILVMVMSYFIFFLMILLNIFILIATLFYMAKIATSSDRSENTRFNLEKERYWVVVKVFAILSVMWTAEVMSWSMKTSYESQVMADVIKTFSAGVITYLLVWKPKVYHLLFERYKSFTNEEINDP